MCEDRGKFKESGHNHFVDVGSFWSYLSKKRVIEANGVLVTPVFPDKITNPKEKEDLL